MPKSNINFTETKKEKILDFMLKVKQVKQVKQTLSKLIGKLYMA